MMKDMQKDTIGTEYLKKTEKLASAIYLITGFFGDKEPLKWDLRGTATRLLSVSMDEGRSFAVREIISLLAVAKSAGLVSDMNHGLISGEFEKLLASVESPALSPEDFFVPASIAAPEPLPLSPAPAAVSVPLARMPEPAAPIKDKTELLPPVPAVQQAVRKPEAFKEFGAVAVKKNSRQSAIIALLKRKKEIMIKDVSPLIDGVSEKTIQRELLGMVKSGLLTKIGEKRWSRYSLAN